MQETICPKLGQLAVYENEGLPREQAMHLLCAHDSLIPLEAAEDTID